MKKRVDESAVKIIRDDLRTVGVLLSVAGIIGYFLEGRSPEALLVVGSGLAMLAIAYTGLWLGNRPPTG